MSLTNSAENILPPKINTNISNFGTETFYSFVFVVFFAPGETNFIKQANSTNHFIFFNVDDFEVIQLFVVGTLSTNPPTQRFMFL